MMDQMMPARTRNQPKKIFKSVWLFAFIMLFAACSKSGGSSNNNNNSGSNQTVPASFARGADISWLTQMESSGYSFYDSTGTRMDCIQILKNLGLNSIRLRAWVNPAGGWCNTTDLVSKAVRAARLGMRIMIDFHYSDTWADPGHQTKPAAWASLTTTDLSDTLYSYTYHVLDTLRANGVFPEWVQVGNETDDGLLWEDGRASTHMQEFATLVSAGYQAVKAVNDSIKVVVHVSNGFNNSLFRWVFDGLKAYGANWDVIGMSLYPSDTNWQSYNQQCLANMQDMVSRYGKPVMIAEIGMSATAATACRSFIADLVNKTGTLAGGKGLGVFYWEPECYNFMNYSLGAFDGTGKPTMALYGFTDS
jgi:arabinogalactan endo-1,4-beta-galactosidase